MGGLSIALFTSLSLAVEKDDLKQLGESAHEMFHDHADEGALSEKLKAWVANVNPKQFVLRQSLLSRQSAMSGSEHMQNLVLIFGTSHLIEMLFAPVSVSIAMSQEAPTWVIMALAGIGGVISVPGFADPLCYSVNALYAVSQKFRSCVNRVRMFITRAKPGVNVYADAHRLVRELQKHNLLALGDRLILSVYDSETQTVTAQVLLELAENKVQIVAIRGVPADQEERPQYSNHEVSLQALPWSVRRVIAQIGGRADVNHLFYIERELSLGWYKIKDGLLALEENEVKKMFDCAGLLNQ